MPTPRERPRSRHRYRALAPLVAACAGAAAIVVALAFTVLPTDADPDTFASGPVGDVDIARGADQDPPPQPTPTPTRRTGRDIIVEVLPTPTPRVIRRPQPAPTAAQAKPARTDAGDDRTEPPEPEPTVPDDAPEPTIAARSLASAAPDLVENGGFEARESAWYLEQGAGVVAGDAHDGDRYLLIEATGGYADQRLAVEPGTTYQVSVWAMASEDASGAEIGFRYEDSRFNEVPGGDSAQIPVNAREWTNITFTFTPPDGATQALITFWNPPGSAALFVDDVSVREEIT